MHELQRSVNEASAAASAASDQIRAVQDLLKTVANPPPAVLQATDSLASRLAGIGQSLGVGGQPAGGRGRGSGGAQPIGSQLSSAKNQIMGWTAAPSAQQIQLARESREQLVKLITDLNDAITAAIPALYTTLSDNKIQPPQMKPIPPVKMPALPD
jgi:hypothetical protein